MSVQANDRRTAPESKWDPERIIINSDILSRISRLTAATQFIAHGAIALEGNMNRIGVSDVGYVLELMGEEGARIQNDIDRMNGGV